MKKDDIGEHLALYKNKRGWGRFFFGDTRGIEDLKAFYERLPNNRLQSVYLNELFLILYARRVRLNDRPDEYSTPVGKSKLTNIIYLSLEQKFVSNYLHATYPTYHHDEALQTSFEHLIGIKIPKSNKQEQLYIFDIRACLMRVTLADGFVNPCTNKKLSDAAIQQLMQHPTYGQAICSLQRWQHSLQENRDVIDQHESLWDICILKNGKKLNIATWITTCQYQMFKHNHLEIEQTLHSTEPIRNPALLVEFNRLTILYRNLKALANHDEIRFDKTPLMHLFRLSDETFINVIALLDAFEPNIKSIRHPKSKQELSQNQLRELMEFLSQNSLLRHAKKNVFIDTIRKLNMRLLQQSVDKTPLTKVFTSEDGHLFNVDLLLQTFTEKGFINPYTQSEFSDNDLDTLRHHALAGPTLIRLEQLYKKYNCLVRTKTAPVTLLHLYISRLGEVINIYETNYLVDHVTQLYLENKLQRDELIAVLNLAYEQSEHDLVIKSGLTIQQEHEFNDDILYQNLVKAVRLKKEFSFDHINIHIFWKLVRQEFNHIVGGRWNYLDGAKRMQLAIKAFEENPMYFIKQAGDYGTVYYYDIYGNNEYLVRSPESYGTKNGLTALKMVADTFKGAFLTALRHNKCRILFDKMDKPGICIAEKTRNIAAWSDTIGTDTLLELLAGYQDELTGSGDSQARFLKDQDAVNFILNKHRGEKFIYEDENGNKQQGSVTSEVIMYYLKTWMGHEGIRDIEMPACFKQLESCAATINNKP